MEHSDIRPIIEFYHSKLIADTEDSYLALDGIESGYGKRIPLWMFGLLY